MRWFWLIMLWLKETGTGLVRNIWGNLTAVLLTVACLSLFSVSYVIGMNAEYFAEVLNDKIEIRVDIKEEVKDYKKIESEFETIAEIESIRFVSKDEAFSIMESEMDENAEILYAVGENPFPAQFIVKVQKPSDIDRVVEEIKKMNIASDVQYGKDYVEKLVAFTKTLQNVGYVITFATALFTVYIVTNVIKYNIDKRKEELRIKRLTGAGMWTIRLPFVLEAIIITLMSGFAVYFLFNYGYGQLVDIVKGMVSYAPIISLQSAMDALFVPLIVISLSIGILGSFIATQRFIAKY